MAGPPRRVRFNEKGRQSSVGGSHKGKKASRSKYTQDINPNAEVIDDATRIALAEQERRRREVRFWLTAPSRLWW